mmetsp:Transcript_24862/g.77294  ORF Transcript_24862/g.77294 Transcript_24862/m.77294 type:complete len:236 (+) Transcript_24862:1167-1874(+)
MDEIPTQSSPSAVQKACVMKHWFRSSKALRGRLSREPLPKPPSKSMPAAMRPSWSWVATRWLSALLIRPKRDVSSSLPVSVAKRRLSRSVVNSSASNAAWRICRTRPCSAALSLARRDASLAKALSMESCSSGLALPSLWNNLVWFMPTTVWKATCTMTPVTRFRMPRLVTPTKIRHKALATGLLSFSLPMWNFQLLNVMTSASISMAEPTLLHASCDSAPCSPRRSWTAVMAPA